MNTVELTPVIFDDKQAWLAARRKGIGSSDASALLGLNRYKTPFSLWAEKTGLADLPEEELEYQEWGHRLEAPIAAKYVEETGRILRDPGPYTLFLHPERSFFLTSPDRLIVSTKEKPEPGILEIKTASVFKADEWAEEPPLAYQVQLQWQLLVLGYPWGSMAVLLGGQKFRWQDQARHDRLIALLIEKGEEFWDRVQRGEPPPPDASPLTKEILGRMHPKHTPDSVVELPPEALDWDRMRAEGKALIERGEAMVLEGENHLKACIGEAEAGVALDGTRWSWKSQTRKAYTVPEAEFRVLRRHAPK